MYKNQAIKKFGWHEDPISNGMAKIELSSWQNFYDFVIKKMLTLPHFIWRGQRNSKWKIISSIDRLKKSGSKADRELFAEGHLQTFRLAIRGRRGPNPAIIDDDDENEWWALGQHQGLVTPLLDWTESPFVALYFAFVKKEKPRSGMRTVWALGDLDSIYEKNMEIEAAHKSSKLRAPILEFIRPYQDENTRLVSQAGMHVRVPQGDTVDDWISRNFQGKTDGAALIRIDIPEKIKAESRDECLRALNKMNINHLSLFPDLYGAGQFSNMALEIDQYLDNRID